MTWIPRPKSGWLWNQAGEPLRQHGSYCKLLTSLTRRRIQDARGGADYPQWRHRLLASSHGTTVPSARDIFVARQPIFDARKRVYGYELLFRGGLENVCSATDETQAAGDVLHAAWLTFGLPTLVGDRKAFINFTRDLLLAGYAETLPPSSTVIELIETVDGDTAVTELCRRLKQLGYGIALDDFVYRPTLEPLIELADIIKIDLDQAGLEEQIDHVRRLASHQPMLLAERVETADDYRRAVELGFDFVQGYFFCRPEVLTGRQITGTRFTSLKLLQAVSQAELDIGQIETALQADVSAAHRLLKYLGSFAFGFRAEIRSINHALVLLGQSQIRQWVSLVALGEMGADKPPELLVQAAARGKFCEKLAEDAGMTDRAPELFLAGALSLIDAMLDRPMAAVLADLPLAKDVSHALLGQPSPLRPVLAYAQGYERGDWSACAALAHELHVSESSVLPRYQEAVAWATDVLRG